MSIQSEITRISGNVSDALDAIEDKGVTIPTGSNSDDLATLIGQIDAIQYKTGAIATFNSGTAGMPITSVIVHIDAVQAGSGTPSSSNVRAISGWSTVNLKATGKNLLVINNVTPGAHTYNGAIFNLADGVFTVSGSATSAGDIVLSYLYSTPYLVIKPETFVFSGGTSNLDLNLRIRGGASNRYIVCRGTDQSFTLAENEYVDRVYVTTVNGRQYSETIAPMIRRSSASSDFASYSGTSESISLGRTVYGGTLNVTTGRLTVTHGYIASYNGETLPGEWISSIDAYASGTYPSTGAQVVYELASPETYSLTPVEIDTLLGENNIWADTGDIEVTIGGGSSAVIEELDVSASGTYTATGGVDGYSPVVVPAGTAGTPTATKGTVSNHAITVTPSVTNTSGFITGSTINGTGVSVSASELVSGNKSITQNGTDIDVANYSTVSVAVSGKNVQAYIGYASRTANSYGATDVTLTVAKTGTYKISWCAWRSSSQGTMGTNLYIGSSAGTNQQTWTGTYGQCITLNNQSLTANTVLTLYATSGSTTRTIYVGNLIIEEQ